MKEEKLFEALGDIGDDLLHTAQHRRFSNGWRKWLSLAACLLVITSVSVLALPYFPVGCDAGKKTTESIELEKNETAAEEIPESSAIMDTVPEIEMEIESAGIEERGENLEEYEKMEEPALRDGTDMVCYGSSWYYLDDSVVLPGMTPGNLGEQIGVVEDTTEESFHGCPVYAASDATWFSNYTVDGVFVPSTIYVLTENGYVYARTCNEKTVSRYSAADVAEIMPQNDRLLRLFVQPLEIWQVGTMEDGVLSSQQMNRLFLASLNMNTGLDLSDIWRKDGEKLVVPAEDIRRRLERFLDTVDYDPAQTEEYDPDSGCLVFDLSEDGQTTADIVLDRAAMEEDTLHLWVGLPDGGQQHYVLRFDDDSWRYVQIASVGEYG